MDRPVQLLLLLCVFAMDRPVQLLLLLCVFVPVRAPLRLNELDLLKNFYNVTNGAEWQTNTNWHIAANSQCGYVDQSISPNWPYVAPEVEAPQGPGCIYKDPCVGSTKWHGVGCIDPCFAPTDGDNCAFGRVTYLNLPKNKVQGTIPPAFLDELINITFLDLSFNEMSGTIPTQIGKLRNVRKVNLENNRFEGSIPTQIAHLAHALGSDGTTVLDVSHNNLTGNIPSEIAYLEALEYLDFSNNPNFGSIPDANNWAMHPPIPTEIGLLEKLQVLNIDHCRFQGIIPTELFECRAMKNFYARGGTPDGTDSNQLSGTLPTQIGKWNRLNTFALTKNRISGTVPTQVGDMAILRRIELAENSLSGSMPDAFGNLRHLVYWDTYGNMLTGDLPPSIQNVTSLEYLYVQNEQTDVIRLYRCGERIPAIGNVHNSQNIPSKQSGHKFNWYVQVREYFNYKYNSLCANTLDPVAALEALSGDV